MKKTYQIEVDCANCANLMEEAANKTEGVEKAVVNFMTLKMTVEFQEGQDPDGHWNAVLRFCGGGAGSGVLRARASALGGEPGCALLRHGGGGEGGQAREKAGCLRE